MSIRYELVTSRMIKGFSHRNRVNKVSLFLSVYLYLILSGLSSIPALSAIEVYTFTDQKKEQQYHQLIAELRCPKCQNQNLANSDSGIAQDLKKQTYQQVQAGKSKQQIRQYMIERYGDFITYKTPIRPATYILWYLPPTLLLIAIIILLLKKSHKKVSVNQKEDNKPQQYTNNEKLKDSGILTLITHHTEQKISEIMQDFDNRIISKNQFDQQKNELENQILSAKNAINQPKFSNPPIKIKIYLSILILSLSIISYTIIIYTTTLYKNTEKQSSIYSLINTSDKLKIVADDFLTGKIDELPKWTTESAQDTQLLITVMQKNLHQHADDGARWRKLAEVLMSINAMDSAVQAMERANRISPNDADIAIAYAKTSYIVNKQVMPIKAKKALEKLVRTQPDQQEATMLLIMNETQQGDHHKALQWAIQLKEALTEKTLQQTNTDDKNYKQQMASLEKLITNIRYNLAQQKHLAQ